jgi:hypothetical protein
MRDGDECRISNSMTPSPGASVRARNLRAPLLHHRSSRQHAGRRRQLGNDRPAGGLPPLRRKMQQFDADIGRK